MLSGFCPAHFGVLFCSAVSAADTHLKPLDRAVGGARFLSRGVLECDIVYWRYVAILCMLYKIRRNPVHPLNGALLGPYVPVRVTHGPLISHRYTFAPLRCRTSQYHMTFILLSVPPGTILLTPHSMVWDWPVSRAGPTLFYWLKLLYPYYSPLLFFPFSSSVERLVLWGWGPRTDGEYISLSQPCTADLF